MKTKTARIGSKHPARRAVANLPNYFHRLLDALDAIDNVLSGFGIVMDDQHVWNLSGKTEENVSQLIPIIQEKEFGIVCTECDCRIALASCVSFSYYKMPVSGKYEITVYIT